MANKLSLMTVAEGVETPEQMAFLEASSCDVVQGFYFSRPLPLEALRAFAADPPYQVSSKPLLKPAAVLGESLLKWSFTFESGHPGIDAQHKQLINIINQLDATARSGNRLAESRHAMKALIEYVKEHFSYEEALMRRHGYPESDRHQAEHIGFAEKLGSYDLQLKGNPQFDPNHLLSFVRNWLINHILKTDKQLGGFLRRDGAGNGADGGQAAGAGTIAIRGMSRR
jgi:hemerythrin-like metal-binding protein